MLIFAGVIAVVLCFTPSVDRKPSRVPAAFAENSTTTGHPLSGHLMMTALGAFTCPTKIPEAHEDALNSDNGRTQRWTRCQFFTKNSVTEDELSASDSLGKFSIKSTGL